MKKFLKKESIKRISQAVIVFTLVIFLSKADITTISTTSINKAETKMSPDIAYETKVAIKEAVAIAEENEAKQKDKLGVFLEANEEQIRFFANAFNISYDNAISKIKEINPDVANINEYNIGAISDGNGNIYTYNSIDRGILEFFLNLEKTNPEFVSNNYVPYTGNAEYVEALVEYFSSLYPNVDHKLMLSIGAAESGFYTSNGMLAKNNIYGGMGSNGLIGYQNIEYGVMSYIKKMSDSYYDKGLNTIESIGYVFCPRMENGVKTVSSHWVSLVNNALKTYTSDLRYVTVAQLNDLHNNEINEI